MEKTNENIFENCMNLFHFTHLAKADWKRGVELFYHDAFEKILQDEDEQYTEIYRALRTCPMNEHHVNEFLQLTGQKEQIRYAAEENTYCFRDVVDESLQLIPIRKEGWGYVHLDVSCEEDFLRIHKNKLEAADFINGQAKLAIEIIREQLHQGKNYAKLVISSLEGKMEIEILVEKQDIKLKSVVSKNMLRQNVVEMIRTYEEMRAKKIDQGEWLKNVKRKISYVHGKSAYWCLMQLFKAHIAITEEKFEEATFLLDTVADNIKEESITNYCYYLYLTVLYKKDSVYGMEIYKQVQKIYEDNPDNWQIAWICFYMADMTYETPKNRWMILKDQLQRKCYSPIMYIEAIDLWNQHAELLDELTVENCRVLYYGIRNKLLSMELILKVTYLVEKQKNYTKQLIPILEACYEYVPYDEILVAICTHLMKGNVVKKEAFKWYALGVKKNIRITGIYESYMMARDAESTIKIPKSVLLYFSYENQLPVRTCEILYTYLVKHHKNDDELFLLYQDKMEVFLREQVKKGRVNEELSYLYDEIFTSEKLTTELANSLFPLLFTREIDSKMSGIVNVVVIKDKLCKEERYMVQGGTAIVPLYRMDNLVFLEDDMGNRYRIPMSYEGGRYAWIQQRAAQLEPFMEAGHEASMYYCDSDEIEITSQTLHHYEFLYEDERILASYRKDIQLKLIQYYDDNLMGDELYECLKKISLEQVTSEFTDYILGLYLVYGLECMEGQGDVTSYLDKKSHQYVNYIYSNKKEALETEETAEKIAMTDNVIMAIGNRFRNRLHVSVMCQIAYLHYYSEEQNQADLERVVPCIKEILTELVCERDLFLSFFMKYHGICDAVCGYEGLSFVEYIGEKNSTVILYYRATNLEEEQEFEKEELPEICEGIYGKAFTLLAKEQIEYYFVETTDDDEYIGELSILSAAIEAIPGSKYDRIQRMLETGSGADYEELEQLLKEYYLTQHLVDTMFRL